MVSILTFLTLLLSAKALHGPVAADGLPMRALKQFGETLSTRYSLDRRGLCTVQGCRSFCFLSECTWRAQAIDAVHDTRHLSQLPYHSLSIAMVACTVSTAENVPHMRCRIPETGGQLAAASTALCAFLLNVLI